MANSQKNRLLVTIPNTFPVELETEKEAKMDLAEVFKGYRVDNRLSQTKLGEQLGIEHTTISGIEQRKRKPSPELISRLACVANQPIVFYPDGSIRMGEPQPQSQPAQPDNSRLSNEMEIDQIADRIAAKLVAKGMMNPIKFSLGAFNMPLYRYLSEKLALVGVNTSSAVGAIQGAELLWQAGAIVPEDNRQMILEAVRGDRATLPDDLLLRVADALNLLLAARGVVHPPIDYYDLVQAQNNHSPNHSGQGCEVH